MITEWYCPNCGPIAPSDAEYPGLGTYRYCRTCIDVRVQEGLPPHVTAMQEQIAALQAENAAIKAVLDRAREALIAAWAYLYHHGGQRHAEARYASEIAQVCTYPDCSCMFDMGADNKCWQGYRREIEQD